MTEHAVLTVGDMGWSGVKNGQLLAKAALEFDCLLTVDKNLQLQQSQAGLPMSVLIMHAVNNKFETLKPLMHQVREALVKARAADSSSRSLNANVVCHSIK